MDRAEGFKALPELLRHEKQFLRVQHGPFNIVPALFPAVTGSAGLVGGGLEHVLLQDQLRRSWQVIEQAGCLLVKQGQVLFHALRVQA